MGMSAGKSGELNSEINVTPMVDVMLVLLIIFMVTAPMMQTGVDLELPQANISTLPDQDEKLVLSIDKKGGLFLGADPVAIKWEDLKIKLETSAKVKSDRAVYIQADKNLPYGKVLDAMAIAKEAGVARVMMITDPLPEDEVPGSGGPKP
jgi:biopolymer transport protein TolR